MKKIKNVVAVVMVLAISAGLLTGCGGGKTDGGGESKTQKEDDKQQQDKQTEPPAESWKPDGSINIRVPFKAGGSMDLVARIAAKGMETTYGKTAIVNNMPGANGAIAANDLLGMDARPTEMMTAGIMLFTLAPLFNKDINVSLDDFEIIGSLIAEDFVILTNPEKSGINNFEELIEYGRKNRIICSSNPAGGTTHMLGEVLFGQAGIEHGTIADNGGAQNALAAASGDATICIVSANAARQLVDEGSLIPLACFSEEAFTGYDGFTAPTVKSKGYDIVFKSCNFLMVKKGVDKAVVDQIYNDMVAYRKTDEFKELAENAKYIPDNRNGEEVRAAIEAAAKMCNEAYEKYYTKTE